MRLLFAGTLCCLLASSVQAGTIVSQSLLFRDIGNGLTDQTLSSTIVSDLDLQVATAGWEGTASVATNGTPGTTFDFPYDFELSGVNVTCMLEQGCGALSFQFFDNVRLSTIGDLAGQPFSISVTGSGPAATFSMKGSVNGNSTFNELDDLVAGTYNFNTTGNIVGLDTSNLTDSVFFQISASYGVSSGAQGDVISLPHSFQLLMATSTAAPTPEPATWGLTGGFLLSGIAAFAWRRMRQGLKA